MNWDIQGLEHWKPGSVLTCWHRDILLAAALVRHVNRAGEVVAPMVREYGTPRLMARFIRVVGLDLVYIPPYEKGKERREAMAQLLVPLLHEGKSIFFAADGHRAPALQAREDPLWLAARAGAAVVPFACTASPVITIPTWDSKRIPTPVSRITAMLGSPMPPGSTPAGLATILHSLENISNTR